MKTTQQLRDLIRQETISIKELESSYPEWGDDPKRASTPYVQHDQKIKDAYWRRRNWRDQLAQTYGVEND